MHLELHLPLPDEQIFRYGAMDDIVEILAGDPSGEFSNRELQRLTGYGGPSVSTALSLLVAMGLIVRRDEGNRTLYRIDERRLRDVDDPFFEIPQREFREPLRRFVDRIEESVSAVAGILCFGSVARGEADRTSDVDVFVLVDGEGEPVAARRAIADVVRALEAEPIDGDRYEFEVFVESVGSAGRRGGELLEVFQGGVVLEESEMFQQVRRGVFEAGE